MALIGHQPQWYFEPHILVFFQLIVISGSIEQDEYISLMKDMFKGSDLSDDDIIADFQNGPRDKDGRVTVNGECI